MDRFIPIEKRSKKEQKKFHSMQRSTWNGLNPVTRTVPNGKGYDRKKQKLQDRKYSRYPEDERTCCFLFWNTEERHRGTVLLCALSGAEPAF